MSANARLNTSDYSASLGIRGNCFLLPQTREAALRAETLLNLVAASTSLVAALCATAKSVACAEGSAVISGASWVGSGVANVWRADPNFTTVALPQLSSIDITDIPAPL
jgi:hypothetical protein